MAHINEGNILYHRGNAMLKAVAITKASVVCPDGKEGLPPEVTFSIKLYVSKGLGRLITYFNVVVMITAVATDATRNKAFCFSRVFF